MGFAKRKQENQESKRKELDLGMRHVQSHEKAKRKLLERVMQEDEEVKVKPALKKPLTIEATYEQNIKAQLAKLQLKGKGEKNKRMEVRMNKIIEEGVLYEDD